MRGHNGAALRALGRHSALRSVLGQCGAAGQRSIGSCMLTARSGASRSGALHFMSAPWTSLTGPLLQGRPDHVPWLRAVRWNSSASRMQGVVKMWNEERGFGFIKPEDGGEDVFVHRSALGEGVALTSGVGVSYEGIWDERKRKYRASGVAIESEVAEASGAAPTADAPRSDRPSAQPARPPAYSALHIVASFTDWDIHKDAMSEGRHRIIIRSNAPQASDKRSRREEFQILGDGDWDKRFFPSGGDREEVVVIRPGGAGSPASCDRGKGHGRNWAVEGRPGAAFDIVFDAAAMTVACEEAFSESQGR